MKLFALFLLITIVLVECNHMFCGTSVMRPLVHQEQAEYSWKLFQKRVEVMYYKMPVVPGEMRTIQGILAYDKTHTTASANITEGGLGYDFVKIRMKSQRGEKLHYDIYIYA
ncbi:uncharacterized protein LOC125234101 [Leguminivora glycinivorella]|uniref:uncharacterized protein LOC125234101 n=1 Tax=Leguminivora glycinivorella TaxID=1035111 RepID=UPI00200ECFF1|nr:uncharacterized protein LOC125234101 [Leguminivora glycinivorella]